MILIWLKRFIKRVSEQCSCVYAEGIRKIGFILVSWLVKTLINWTLYKPQQPKETSSAEGLRSARHQVS